MTSKPEREGRHSVGTTVVGGMLAATTLNLLFIPVLYLLVKGRSAQAKVGDGA